MSHLIGNYNDSSHLDVDHYQNSKHGSLVIISQNIGSCHFLHQMTPRQAREMALVLNDAAANAEEAAQQLNGVPA